jgi:hypothetical protein
MQPFDCRVTVQISTGTRIQILELQLATRRATMSLSQRTTHNEPTRSPYNSEGQFFEAYLDRRMRRHGG